MFKQVIIFLFGWHFSNKFFLGFTFSWKVGISHWCGLVRTATIYA